MNAEKKTYTVDEVARLLGIGRVTAYQAVKRGEIPAIHIGRRIVVPVEAIDNLLKLRFNQDKPGLEAWEVNNCNGRG